MRRRLAWVFMALAVMLTVGFLVPLAISVRSQAEVRGIASAQSNARGVATSLAAVAGSTGVVPGLNEAEFILSTFGEDNILIILTDEISVGYVPLDLESLPIATAGSVVADVDGAVCESYGVWIEKNTFGKKYMGINRTTFLIAEGGQILKIWRRVKVKGHADEVLDSVTF